MIRIWKQKNGSFEEIEKSQRNCWIDVVSPTAEELLRLQNEFKIPEDFLTDVLDIDERSRTEIEGRHFMIIMRIPVFRPEDDTPYYTIPLGIIMSPLFIITICLYPNEVVNPRALQKIPEFSLENRPNFVLHLLFRSATFFLRYLKEINKITENIENELRKTTRNKDLTKLHFYEKCLIYFTTSLKSNEILIAKLQNSRVAKSNIVDEDLIEDVIIENRQASEMARVHSEIIENLMEFFSSVINNNLNNVVKLLTAITIIVMFPNLVASYFGMNVPNGWEHHHLGFVYAFFISVVVAVLGVLVFKKWKLL